MNTKYYAYAVLLFVISGCTSLPKDYGQSEVNTLLTNRDIPAEPLGATDIENHTSSLIKQPLTVDSVTQLALMRNASLKKTYAQLGLAAADVYEAGRIRNPIFSFSQLDSNQSGERDLITLGFITSLADLITLPSRKDLAETQFATTKQRVGAEVLNTLQEVQHAYFSYQTAEQIAEIKAQIYHTAQLSSQLAHRYRDAGNINERELLEEITKASDAMFDSLDAKADALEARTELANLLGLKIEETWQVDKSISLPPHHGKDIQGLVSLAHQSRLDLAASELEVERLAHNLGVTNWSRFIGDLDVGYERERETDGAKLKGPVIEWEIPIFSQHSDAKLRAASELQIAMAEFAHLKNQIHNDVHLNHAKADDARKRAQEYKKNVMPTKSAIVSRAQEEENFMLIGTFELLHTKIEEYDSYIGYLMAIRDYWIADSQLMHAVGDSIAYTAMHDTELINVEMLLNLNTSPTSHDEHAHH